MNEFIAFGYRFANNLTKNTLQERSTGFVCFSLNVLSFYNPNISFFRGRRKQLARCTIFKDIDIQDFIPAGFVESCYFKVLPNELHVYSLMFCIYIYHNKK